MLASGLVPKLFASKKCEQRMFLGAEAALDTAHNTEVVCKNAPQEGVSPADLLWLGAKNAIVTNSIFNFVEAA